jgi:hypothetical protein
MVLVQRKVKTILRETNVGKSQARKGARRTKTLPGKGSSIALSKLLAAEGVNS